MKPVSFLLLVAALFLSFTMKYEIAPCYLNFKTATDLTALDPERLPASTGQTRTLNSNNGDIEVTRIDGYRILYKNSSNAPFVNLKIELSKETSYLKDQQNLLENLNYLNAHSADMETKELIALEFNGYKIHGLSRKSLEVGSTLGTFVMFPGDGITVYFYFNNLRPEFRNFTSVEDYRKQRDRFIDEYTKHLKSCMGH